MKTVYIVKCSAAKMPVSCWGVYRRVAVLEVMRDWAGAAIYPTLISERAIGVVRIVKTWERLHARGTRTAYHRALVEAEKLATALNAVIE